MVKKAEKENKRSPLLPVFALLLIVGLLAVAYVTYRIAFTIAIWVALLAISYFLVAVLVGKDPNDTDAIPLPPKTKKPKTFKRR